MGEKEPRNPSSPSSLVPTQIDSVDLGKDPHLLFLVPGSCWGCWPEAILLNQVPLGKSGNVRSAPVKFEPSALELG